MVIWISVIWYCFGALPVIADSYATQLAAVGTDPGDGVPANPPLVLLHAAETDLEAASTSPAELLFLAATVTLVSLNQALSIRTGFLSFCHNS